MAAAGPDLRGCTYLSLLALLASGSIAWAQIPGALPGTPATQVPLTQGIMENVAPEPQTPPDTAPKSGAVAPPSSSTAPRTAPPQAKAQPPQPVRSVDDDLFDAAVEAVKEKRYGEAHTLFEPLAEKSVYDAQYNLALLLKRGLGRPQDYKTALIWSWRAQLGGIRRAGALSDELIDLLTEPVIEEVRTVVAEGLRQRIQQHDMSAITQLARFNTDFLAEPNMEEAYIWYAIAAAFRLPMGIRMREEIAPEIDPERLIELQAEATKRFDALQVPQQSTAPQPENGERPPSRKKEQGV